MSEPRIPPHLVRRIYSYAESDQLAKVGRGTSKRWIERYSYVRVDGERVHLPPVTADREVTGGGVSFTDLIEVVAIGKFKETGLSVPTIRKVVDASQHAYKVRHPLSMLEFKTDGRDVFVKRDSVLHSVLRNKAQPAWDEILGPCLETLDYRDDFAYRWWPLGKERPVFVDPEYGFGLPVIAGSGVRTEIVRERVEAGDSFEQIARDFSLNQTELESALRFELSQAA